MGIRKEEEKCVFMLQNRVDKLDSGILDTNQI